MVSLSSFFLELRLQVFNSVAPKVFVIECINILVSGALEW